MKSSIVFLDSSKNSLHGTLRGLVIFGPVVLLNYLFFKYYYNMHNNVQFWVALLISSLLIVSAISVQIPSNTKQAIAYTALVGFVVYGMLSFWLYGFGYINITKCLITMFWGIITTALFGYILYLIVQKWPKTFAAVSLQPQPTCFLGHL